MSAATGDTSRQEQHIYLDRVEPELPGGLPAWLDQLFRSDVIGIVAGEGPRILAANPRFLRIIGREQADLDSERIDWPALTPPEWMAADARAYTVMRRTGTSPPVDKEYFLPDGSRVPIRITGTVVSQEPFRWISIVEDRTTEQHYLDALRKAIIPPTLPQPPGMAVYADFHASDGYTGDFYDLFPLQRRADWGLVIGDVTGHGHQAASLTAMARHTVQGAAIAHRSASSALAALNHALLEAGHERYCTAVFARLRSRGAKLRVLLSRAGHPYPLVVRRDGDVERVEADGMILGIVADPDFEQREVVLQRGDVMVLYTDGLVERHRGEPAFSTGMLERTLATAAGRSPREVVERVLHRVQPAVQGRLSDDTAIVAFGPVESRV